MDKKSIIGLVLIFGIFVGYMWWVSPSKEEIAERQRVHDSMVQAYNDSVHEADSLAALYAGNDSVRRADSLAQCQVADMGAFNAAAQGNAEVVKVCSDRLNLELSTRGAMVRRVVVAGYETFQGNPLELIGPADDNMNLVFSTEDNRTVNTKDLFFTPYVNGKQVQGGEWTVAENDSLCVSLRAELGDSVAHDRYLEFRYLVRGGSYEVDFAIHYEGLQQVVRNTPYLDFVWKNRMQRQEKVSAADRGKGTRNSDRERFYSNIYYKPPKDDVDCLKTGKDDSEKVRTNLEWVAFKQQFFCAILNANSTPFQNADLELKTDGKDTALNYLTDMQATIGLPYSPQDTTLQMGFYFGPTKFRDLRHMHRSYEKMLPLGWTIISKSISRWLIIPAFNFLERFNWNYGLIIIIFTLLIRLVLLPLVYKSYRGSAIMRILKPEMDALNKKFPKQEQAMQKQQAAMALQKRAGYNPMAGCLPMLIQMPFLTAMFMFFPTAIELRQKSFLWCDDLSNYDSILDFGFNIPLYGDHVSLFCLLMFGMQFFYTWYTMRGQQMNNGMPGMKFMMYFMPFMMLFIFNSQSAGLNIYYFISLTFTMTVMMLIRRFTSEAKVRAHMVAYDQKHAGKPGKTKKKSNFAKRLEELQKQAEAMQKQRNNR